ncbi:MAG: energy-coupling factor transporter ATPase [Clostridia bacterium]|nr:energy-coupling factor transporter ATPase [Clostridia bacterium]
MSIEIMDLSYVYMKGTPYEKHALKEINIKIEKGEFVGIIGHTGSGKSTLIQHLNGILKPAAGNVTVNGISVGQSNLKTLRQQVGIVFQYPEHQLFEETVYKDIGFALVKQGMDSEKADKKIKEAIKAVGLDEEVLSKSPYALSGGQKRRAAIAGVLVMDPQVLVLDEPAAGLDPKGRDEIYSFIKELHKKTGATVILVSHSMEDIAKLVERVIVMNEGAIYMDGTPKDIFRFPEKLEEIGLSAPQITYLMKRMKNFIPGIDETIITVAQAKENIKKILGGKKVD